MRVPDKENPLHESKFLSTDGFSICRVCNECLGSDSKNKNAYGGGCHDGVDAVSDIVILGTLIAAPTVKGGGLILS